MKYKEYFDKMVFVVRCMLMLGASILIDTILVGGLIVAPIYHFLLK